MASKQHKTSKTQGDSVKPAQPDTDWSATASSLQSRSDEATKARLSGVPSAELKALLDQFSGFTLPKLTVSHAPLSQSGKRLQEMQVSDALSGLTARSHRSVELSSLAQLERATLSCSATPELTKQEILKQIDLKRQESNGAYQEAIKLSPEAFLAAHSADLLRHRREYERGRIVKTPYVVQEVSEIIKDLSIGNTVFISGETGTGKTEIARIAAKTYSGKDALLVRGYAGMSSDELFGHMTLTDKPTAQQEQLRNEISSSLSNYAEHYPDASEEDKAAVVRGILSRSKTTTTEYLLGSVYEAARTGCVVIIDEANYIPPELLAKMNDIMTKRVGEKVNVQEDGIGPITVQKGFGIIFTGNLNPESGQGKQRYVGRFEFDAAFSDRITVRDYKYLPQATQGEPRDHTLEQKQLYLVALTTALLPYKPQHSSTEQLLNPSLVVEKLESRYGTALLPGGAKGLDTIWRLTKLAAVTQQAFAGEILDGNAHGFQISGSSTGYRPAVSLSPRALIRVIESWKKDGFQFELDHYLAKHLIDRATNQKDKAFLFQRAQKAGFFKSDGWEKNPNYEAILSVGFIFKRPATNTSAKESKDRPNKSEPCSIVPAINVIESVWGAAPNRSTWPDESVSKQTVARQVSSDWRKLSARLDGIQKRIHDLGNPIELSDISESPETA